MRYLLIISLTFTTCVNATVPFLVPRQSSCDEGEKLCANGCVPSSYTCCHPAAAGACEPGAVCYVGNNGLPGCCPADKDCSGEAGFDGKSFDEPTTTADEPANITEASGTTANGASDQYSDYGASDQYTSDGASDQYTDDGDTESTGAFEAGACNLIDGTVGYLMVVAIALLV
ncbi:hypothetical protein FSHL1_007027 [Fusarium sambucinum]